MYGYMVNYSWIVCNLAVCEARKSTCQRQCFYCYLLWQPSSLKSLSAAKVTSALVADTVLQALRQLAIYNSLQLVWVPGHRGIHGNEKADALARKASAMPFIGPEPFAGITVTMVQRDVHLWAVNEQSCLWQNTAKCRQAKQLVKQPNIRLTKYALKLSRKDLRVLAGLLTGHADLNRHLTNAGS